MAAEPHHVTEAELALLETIWSIGEFVGYVTGRAGGPAASAQASVA